MPKLDAYVSWCFKVGMINILKLGMNLWEVKYFSILV
jgi:hypothetical protein